MLVHNKLYIKHSLFEVPSDTTLWHWTDVAAVAYDALPYLSLRPESTIFNAKRFIGGDLNNSATQSYATAHPYRVVPANMSKHSKVGFELAGYESSVTGGGSNGTAVNKIITPENVGTEVSYDIVQLIKCNSAKHDSKEHYSLNVFPFEINWCRIALFLCENYSTLFW